MNTRAFPLLAGSIGLSILSGCGPTIVGEWKLSEWSVDGDTRDLEYSYGGYKISLTALMEIEPNGAGSFDMEQEFEGYGANAGRTETLSVLSGDVEWDVVKGETYEVKIELADSTLNLECTVDGDEMGCEGDQSSGADHVMRWARE